MPDLKSHIFSHPRFGNYALEYILGQGGSSVVFKAFRKSDGKACAIKLIDMIRLKRDRLALDAGPFGVAIAVPIEVYVMRRLKHPNIITLLDFFGSGPYFVVVTEYIGVHSLFVPLAPGVEMNQMFHSNRILSEPSVWSKRSSLLSSESDTSTSPSSVHSSSPQGFDTFLLHNNSHFKSVDLFAYLERHGPLNEQLARYVFMQIVEALVYLKSRNVFHSDLKDENIVLDEHFRVKLIDFGSAHVVTDVEKEKLLADKFFGTFAYACPEILEGKPYHPEKGDVWTLGSLLYNMIFGQYPFSTASRAVAGLYDDLKRKSRTPISEECRELLSVMLQVDPEKRATLENIQSSAFASPKNKGAM